MSVDEQVRRNYSRFSRGKPRSSYLRARKRRGLLIFFAAVLMVAVASIFAYDYFADDESVALARSSAPIAPQSQAVQKERTAALPPLNLPADDAPHGSAMEWWYYSGVLDAKGGQRFGFHMVVFVANGLIKHTVMHAALTDLQNGKRYTAQMRTAGTPANAGTNGFDFRQEAWQVTATPASHKLHAVIDGGAEVSLALRDGGQVVAHRAPESETPGLLDFGTSGISYYYSRPRLQATGEVTVAGKPLKVSGDIWFDHQWGEFDVLTLGWNWFALHLSDGSDLMLYQLFDMEGRTVMTAGTISNVQGSVPLKDGEVELIAGSKWTSPRTRIAYPTEWRLKLPSGVLDVKPFQPDSEFDSSTTTANVYWEGPVKVSGVLTGEGFLELSGYDRLGGGQAPRK
ncbi:lipocalin family protein [Variovorax sp. Sphag1AA]|uniref:lipocalin family protein n=1 Tax=Variovorax sp. Sphag1AA TaxID=2587027 RepID=UPI00160C8955|nr:lipocalin family protein [Variovorax sp. Sphag1AA]MBB3181721.1 putative secreted hydrolase [Variovorax sp. Sphag1AA]